MKKNLRFFLLVICVALTIPQISGQALPASWNYVDVGVTQIPGSSTFNDTTGTFTISGSGLNWWDKDDGQFAFVKITGNFTFKARVVTFEGTLGGSAKTGIDARNNLDSMTTSVMMAWEDWGGLATTARKGSGIMPTWQGGSTPGSGAIPWWLEMVRHGDTIFTYESMDNITWKNVDTLNYSTLLPTLYVGLGVSPNGTELATATYDSVQITGNVLAGVSKQILPKQDLILYPNPAENSLFIRYQGIGAVKSISISDLKGANILNIDPQMINNPVNVSSLAPGMYFMKFTTSQGIIISKFIRK